MLLARDLSLSFIPIIWRFGLSWYLEFPLYFYVFIICNILFVWSNSFIFKFWCFLFCLNYSINETFLLCVIIAFLWFSMPSLFQLVFSWIFLCQHLINSQICIDFAISFSRLFLFSWRSFWILLLSSLITLSCLFISVLNSRSLMKFNFHKILFRKILLIQYIW